MKQNKIKLICITGVFTALAFVFTAYLHIPSHTGYTHIGDGIIYLSACILPLPYGIFVGVCSGLLADLLSGFAIWAPGTAIIKLLTVLFFSSKTQKILSLRNCLALIPAGIVCFSGYYLYEALITQNFIAPIAGIPGYITQSVLSSILFILVGASADKLKIKNHILK